MGHPCLPLLQSECLEGIEQILVPTLHQWAVSIQGQVQIPLLGIPPDFSADGLPPGLGNWIIKASEAIDEMIPPIEPQPDLESTVVVPHPRWILQHPSPCTKVGLRADTP